jgi:hypothetical protein
MYNFCAGDFEFMSILMEFERMNVELLSRLAIETCLVINIRSLPQWFLWSGNMERLQVCRHK